MSLQDIYYIMSIVYMTLLSIILVFVAVLMFMLMKKVGEISDNINNQITKVGRITSNAEEISESVTEVATGALRKVSSLVGARKSKT